MFNNEVSVTREIGGRKITLATGTMARQAGGAVVVTCGDTMLLATATMSKEPKENIDFLPLTIEYAEKMYSAGKIPGGFFKRESRPSNAATLTARLIDRPLRPCFPKNLYHDVQVIVTVLSCSADFPPEFLGIIGASAALSISDIPFTGPVGAVVVCEENGNLVINPNEDVAKSSSLNIMIAGTAEAIMMVEAGSTGVSEERILEAILFGHQYIKETVLLQQELISQAAKPKKQLLEPIQDVQLGTEIAAFVKEEIETNMLAGHKKQMETFIADLELKVKARFIKEDGSNTKPVMAFFQKAKKEQVRRAIIHRKVRPDGRGFEEIRPIDCKIGLLPAVHGSALFTRGETQSLGVITLGSADDEQMEEGPRKTFKKPYYFHYNFPPYSVGEVGFMRTGRRELGHGALAERALSAVLPTTAEFPYTIRIVSEILESNGSSSMASVCSGALALMDGGVPIKAPVAGIAMGLLIDGADYVILSDIQGLEDHYGDMDFKVAGTKDGITALQLDIKVKGLSAEILRAALTQARQGRLHILGKMNEVIDTPKLEVSPHAPKIEYISIPPDKIGVLIGPGGKMIKKIQEETACTINVLEGNTGQVCISAPNQESVLKAKKIISLLTREVEKGEEFVGKVVRVMNYGIFVEIAPGKEGLVHVSNMGKRIDKVEELFENGQSVNVRVREIDSQNRISLAMTIE